MTAERVMVRPERFELPTFWFVAIVVQRINKLHGLSPTATPYYKCISALRLSQARRQSVVLGRVWWWAQNWVQ